ncbi:MAG: AAA family ATPase [Gammaproteobacteria bacterium]
MKILKLHFKNINSLEGENRVDFEAAPFSDTGVFAITGPNGSGKSSILDAITLGLYGETFRFNRPARHVMTRRTAECFSEIEFSLGQNKYRSLWRAEREGGDPEGELLPAEMKLVQLNGSVEILADSQQQVCTRISDLTGMNFRNFTRSIMLAQGDFAAFLNALDNERMAILETIISSDIYADYKKEITDKAQNAQKQLQHLEQELALIPLLEPEKLEASEHDLADFNDQFLALQTELDDLRQRQFAHQKFGDLLRQKAGQENYLRQLQVQAKEIEEKLARIAVSHDASIFKDEIEAIKQRDLKLQEEELSLESYRSELRQLEHAFAGTGIEKPSPEQGQGIKSIAEQQQAIGDVRYQISQLDSARYSANMNVQSVAAQIRDKQSELALVSDWLAAHAGDESLLTHFPDIVKLKNLRAEIVELTEKRKGAIQRVKTTNDALKNQQSAIEKEKARLARMELQLESEIASMESLAQGRQIEDFEELRLEQQERVQSFKELNQLAIAYRGVAGVRSGIFGLFRRKEGHGQEAEELSLDLERLWDTIKREDNIRQILDAALAQEAMMRRMASDRHLLVDGKPCPLCGALQHPYASKPPAVGSSQQALADQQAKLKMLRAQADKLEMQLNAVKKRSQLTRSNQAQAQKISAQWTTLSNRLNIQTHDLEIENASKMRRLLDSEEKQLKEIVFAAAKYRSKKATLEKLRHSIVESRSALEQLQSGLQQRDAEWRERPDDRTDIETRLAQCVQQEKELTAQVTEQLAMLGEKSPAKGKENAFFDRLNSRRREYQSYDMRRKSLDGELEALMSREAALRDEIQQCNVKLETCNQRLKTEEIAGLHLALLETRRLIAEQEQKIARQKADREAVLTALRDKIRGTPFADVGELAEMIDLIALEPNLEQQLIHLTAQMTSVSEEHEKLLLELEAMEGSVDSEASLEDIELKMHQVAEKLEITHFEIRHLETVLSDQQQYRQKYDAAFARLQDQQAITRQCLAEETQLTEDSGMAFRRRVQQRIADRLLEQTNAILEKISGRYYIRQAPSEQGLALEIEDTFQGNARRLPKTLSGGEAFVVSLALALGLSEMASNGKSVDSLFLDEGFGNLDAETLYTVITTLEGLHTHGKTVGVISHVESVHKRFKAQLQVVKKPNGMGMLKKAS